MTATADPTPALTEIYLYLTGSCNLKCRHCWIAPSFGTTAGKRLPWCELKKIIEQAMPLGLRSIKLTGGEPFLHPEINRILYALREMKLSIRMETNGTLIGEEEARALRDAEVSFSISLDGPTAPLHDDLRGIAGLSTVPSRASSVYAGRRWPSRSSPASTGRIAIPSSPWWAWPSSSAPEVSRSIPSTGLRARRAWRRRATCCLSPKSWKRTKP